MKMREWTTGRIMELQPWEKVKIEVLKNAGWRVLEEPVPSVVVTQTEPPVIFPEVVVVKEPTVGIEVVTPADEDDLALAESAEAPEVAQDSDDVEPVEPVVIARKGENRKAGRPKKSAHAWVSNLPEGDE